MDRPYRTIASRRARALIGLSAGGYGATIIGFHHPATFSVTEAWSGYFHPTTPERRLAAGRGRRPRQPPGQRPRLRGPALAIYKRNPSFLGFYVGNRDTRFLAENEQFAAELEAAHVPHTFAIYPGTHSGGSGTSTRTTRS